MLKSEIQATVRKVNPDGRRGPYVSATSKGVKGTITFSLLPEVWHSSTFPQMGTFVVLSDLQKRGKGWIAMSARLYTLADESPTANQERNEL